MNKPIQWRLILGMAAWVVAVSVHAQSTTTSPAASTDSAPNIECCVDEAFPPFPASSTGSAQRAWVPQQAWASMHVSAQAARQSDASQQLDRQLYAHH